MLASGQIRHASHGLALACRLSLLIISTLAVAQEDLQEVHILPLTGSPAMAHDPLLKGPTQLKVKVDLVLVPVTVIDAMNRPALGLNRENFRLYENKQLQAVHTFSQEDAPVSVGVILDTSASMANKLEYARQAVMEFMATANPEDEFFMVTFSERPVETAGFNASPQNLQNELAYLAPKGRTALLDALYLGIAKMRDAKYPRKALLIISDGGDNHSRYTEPDIRRLVRETDVMIYAIGIYDHFFETEEERLGPLLLDNLSKLTGGHSFEIDKPADLASAAASIGVLLRNLYVLGYKPDNTPHDGKWHKIRVTLMPSKGLRALRVNVKQGYYAPTE